MKREYPIVISIAAVSGGGKTTIASFLKDKLQNSKAIFFDDYEFDGPDNMIEWIDRGCNPDEHVGYPKIGKLYQYSIYKN